MWACGRQIQRDEPCTTYRIRHASALTGAAGSKIKHVRGGTDVCVEPIAGDCSVSSVLPSGAVCVPYAVRRAVYSAALPAFGQAVWHARGRAPLAVVMQLSGPVMFL